MFRKSAPAAPKAPQASIADTAPCQKSLHLHVGNSAIEPVRSAILAEFQKRAALPGFRKGKAPAQIVERHYAKDIQEETLQRVTKQAIEQAAKDHNLKPVGPFEITTADFKPSEGLTIKARVEVEPEFALGEYKGIPLKAEPVEVSAAEIEKALSALQESMAQLTPAKEGAPKERQLPRLDDELAKDLGYETLEKLKAHLGTKLRERRCLERTQALETSLCDELLRRHPFEVPAQLVARQTQRLTRDFKVRLLLSGVPETQVDEEVSKFADQLQTSAQRRVKLSFILDRVAAQESITVAQEELVQRLWQVSQRWKKDPAQVRKIFDEQALWPSAVSAIRQEKTLALLMSAALIEDGQAKREAPAG